MTSETVSNRDLCALMDGECGPAAGARIEAALALSPQCAERLALWRRNDAALRFAVAGGGGGGAQRANAAPVIEGMPALPERADAESRVELARLRRKSRAATVAAVAGGAGAGALALAILLLAQ